MDWIVTDDISQETWRRLLEFANIELAVNEIERRHGLATSKSLSANYVKQAKQVRVSVLQAKEYFEAASESSLFTSANHAYYGMVAIASMMMLILGDGKRALDFLRRDPKNSHHGLSFSTGSTAADASIGLSLVSKTYAEICSAGHFANWYSTLPRRGIVAGISETAVEGGSRTSYVTIGTYETKPISDIAGTKKSILDILKYFPDLNRDLSRYGVAVPSSRTTHTVFNEKNGKIHHTWLVHGAGTPQALEAVLSQFRAPAAHATCFSYNFEENAVGGIVKFSFSRGDKVEFSWPTARDTLNHDTISYAEELDLHEIADCYLVAYQLSMLSRYFPDLWIGCIESHCKAAKLIEQAVDILLKKFPILALSMLTDSGLVISTHREPWK